MSPIENFQHYRDRIQQLNGELNAFLHLRLEEAEAEAGEAEARFAAGKPLSAIDGLCVGVKANIAVKGLPHHAGIGAYRDDIASEDAEVIVRLKQAGAIILGIVNMHEGALGATTDNEVFGRTYNPWGKGLTPGGSSGGSAAAVAAGLCDMALGSDTMGSVRIPSAYCGVHGFKATTGRVSNDQVIPLSTSLDHVGPHARSVAALKASASVLLDGWSPRMSKSLNELRIGIWNGMDGVETDAPVREGFAQFCGQISAFTSATMFTVIPPDYHYSKSRRAGLLVSEVEGYDFHAERLAENPDGFSEMFRKMLNWGHRQPADALAQARAQISDIRAGAAQLFGDVDLVVSPVAPQQAFSFDAAVPANQADFTAWANFAALPAIALTIGVSEETGLPLAVQLIAAEGQDEMLLDIAGQLEAKLIKPVYPAGYEPD